jgi:hypothetical protein
MHGTIEKVEKECTNNKNMVSKFKVLQPEPPSNTCATNATKPDQLRLGFINVAWRRERRSVPEGGLVIVLHDEVDGVWRSSARSSPAWIIHREQRLFEPKSLRHCIALPMHEVISCVQR